MCMTHLLDHLPHEQGAVVCSPAVSRPHAWSNWIAAQQPTPNELTEFAAMLLVKADEEGEL